MFDNALEYTYENWLWIKHVQITFDCTMGISDLTNKVSFIIVHEYLFYYFLMKFQFPYSNSACRSDHSFENRDIKVNPYPVKKSV